MALEILVPIGILLASWLIDYLNDYFSLRQSFGKKRNYDINYEFSLNENDKSIIENNAAILQEFFPDGIPEKIRDLDVDERMNLFKELSERLALSYGLGTDILESIQIIEPEDESKALICGVYNRNSRTITLNKAFLCYDLQNTNASDMETLDRILIDCVDTLIHELRHAFQFKACIMLEKGGDCSTYDLNNRVYEWHENFLDYISAGESVEGYWKQPVENDARNFASYVLHEYMRGVA